uniref:Cytochrome P450 2F2-like isoform X2 n=1 Tax=Geotrypetes seraphini TaxID=260995 RepID=A0A6P8S9I5_GEOSA|nr:cytochrome P450 2F2-like isoform X2 [Geotrypetes seraphini]
MLMLTEMLFTLLLFLFMLKFLKLQWTNRGLPPGPSPLPIIGNLWMLNFQFHHETLIQLANKYGSIFTIWAGETPVIVFSGCKAVRDALISHSQEISGRPTTPFVKEFTQGKGRPLDPSTPIRHAVCNVTACLVFGHRFSGEDGAFQQLKRATNFVVAFNGTHWGRLYDAFPWLMCRIPGPHQKVFGHAEYIHNFVKREIRSHQKNLTEEPKDLIDFYLARISETKDDPSSTFDESNMIQVVTDIFMGSSDTISATLHWAVLYMVAYPSIQEKVQKELDNVLGRSRIIYFEDRKRLPYTNAVIHEFQRFANMASVGLARQCIRDTSIQGFLINKGTIIIANLSSALYDPEHWETPRQFNPNHFLDEEGNFVNNKAFLPFSAGHRVCLGEQQARTELFIFFTNLLRAFTFQLPEGVTEVNMDSIYGTVVQPHPYEICAFSR